MKFNYSLLILLFFSTLFSEVIIQKESDYELTITGSFEIEKIIKKEITGYEFLQLIIDQCYNTGLPDQPELPIYSHLVSLPDNGNYVLKEFKYDFDEIKLDNQIIPFIWEDIDNIPSYIYHWNEWFPQEIINISKPNIMRGNRFSQISLSSVQYNPAENKVRILKDITAKFEIDYSINENPKKLNRDLSSNSFSRICRENILGNNNSRNHEKGSYLFIAPENCATALQPLLRWKEKSGHKTRLALLSETGSTNTEIKNYLQTAYETWDIPPEYVILVGDVTGSFVVPSYYIPGYLSPLNVTDHEYTLLEGEDYFPDILIGRISIQSLNNLHTVINKIISYESNPYLSEEWFNKALMITYVEEYWQQFYSARETKMAVREKLLDFTFTEVDTFFCPYQFGSDQLADYIDTGYSFLNYRGAGSPYLWWSGSGSLFNIYDVNALNNGYMLPMVTSITCGGGNFAYSDIPSCFGETWLITGTPTVPRGAIGFIGPSEHDTKTPFNNALDMGIYQGITREGLFCCGEMLLRGKMELYINYPYCHDMDGFNDAWDSDQFYFYVYNLLGDPGLAVWTDIPKELGISFENEFFEGMNFLEVEIIIDEPDKSGFYIAITNADSLITTGFTDETGIINIPVILSTGSYEVTASKYGYIPKTENLTVSQGDIISLENYNLLSDAVSGTFVFIDITLRNLAHVEATDIQLELISNDDFITITEGTFAADQMEAHDTLNCEFEFLVGDEWKNLIVIELMLNVESSLGTYNFIIPVEIKSPDLVLSEFIVNNFDGYLIQGENADVYIELLNCGEIETSDFTVYWENLNNMIEITNSSNFYSNILTGETGICENSFEIEVMENIITGELAQFKLEIIKDETQVLEYYFSEPVGFINEESPTFCDYGYIAIESGDIGNFTPPIYNWIEINPVLGGDGELIYGGHVTTDGFTITIDLPFTFQYFGINYDKISVCSNGYLAMGETNLIFHRNRTIPSGSGVDAMIAPFWDNLQSGNIYGYYDSENNSYIIEWYDWENVYNPYYEETFEVILYDPEYFPTPTGDGAILFQYNEVNNIDFGDNYATVGIENETQTEGLLLTFADIYPATAHNLEDETAIFFTTIAVSTDDNVITELNNELFFNYPNPFNPETTISFNLTAEDGEDAELVIYNVKGQKVKTFAVTLSPSTQLRTGSVEGQFSIQWNGTDDNNKPVSSGIYFYKLKAGDFQKVRRMIFLK